MDHQLKSKQQTDKTSRPLQRTPAQTPLTQAQAVTQQFGNRRAAQMLQAKSSLQRRPRKLIQRFESNEHAMLGDEGSKGEHGEIRTVELAPDYRLTYGDMTAMAGDFFGGIAEMRTLANAKSQKGVGTREELEYVRVCKVRATSKEDAKTKAAAFSPEVIAAVDKRYYKLALNNRSHFSNPEVANADQSVAEKSGQTLRPGGRPLWEEPILQKDIPNNTAGYRAYHVQALDEAYRAGAEGKGIDQAMAAEAFGSHYLTDAFAGGHMRTARTSIGQHWNPRVPMFNHNLKGFMAQKLAEELEKTMAWGVLSTDAVYDWGALETVTEKINAKGSLTFADVVSGAVHDYDNHHGVLATVGGGETRLFGDGALIDDKGQQHHPEQKKLIALAVNSGMQDIIKAWEAGKKNTTAGDLLAGIISSEGLFKAERLLPKATPDSEVDKDDQRVKWDFDNVNDLLNDKKFSEALALMAAEKVSEFEEVAAELKPSEATAFQTAVINPLKRDPIDFMRQVINWVPNTGGGVGGHTQDDKALEYIEIAKKKNALGTLSVAQKVPLIRDVFSGLTTDGDCALLMEMINAKPGDVKAIVKQIGWDAMEDELGDAFSKKYPKNKYDAVPAH